MAFGLQFNGTNTAAYFTEVSTSGVFALTGEFITGTLSDHGLVMGVSTSNANFIGDVQGAGFYARIANVDSSGQALPIANETRYTWSVVRDAGNTVTVTLDGVGSYTFTAAGVVNFDVHGRNSFGFFFDGQLIKSEISLAGVPTFNWSSTASDHSNTGAQPIIVDTLSSNDSVGVNFATDGSDWIDVGGDADGISLSPFSSTGRYVFNREPSGADRAIDVSVTLTGDPSGGIEWRLIDNATSLPITGYDWSTFLVAPSDGAHIVSVDVPTGTGLVWYKIQLRFTNDTLINTESVLEFGVGVNVVDNGQSNCLRRDVITDTPPAVNANASYCTVTGWQPSFTTGNGAIAKVNALIALLNVPVGYYNNGQNSEQLDYFVNGTGWTRLSSLLTTYMDNYFELMNFDQGERDGILGTSAVTYQAGQQTLYDNLLSQMSRPQSEVTFSVNYGGNSNAYSVGTYTEATIEAVRDGKRAFVAANAGAIFGGHRLDLPLADTIHNLASGYEVAADREIQSYGKHLGLVTFSGDGRTIANAVLDGNELTVNYSAGDDLTKIGSSGATITQVSEDSFSTLLTITATVVNADNVVHTLSPSPSTAVGVRDYYGIDIDVATRQDLVFPSFAQSAAITSTLNLTATGIPDGLYSAEIWNNNQDPMVRISVEDITFTSNVSSLIVDLAVGTSTKTIIDGINPPITGVLCYGDTE